MTSIGIIGFGFMGEAIIQGLRRTAGDLALHVVEKVPERRDLAVSAYAARSWDDDLAGFAAASDIVILAIKPQDAADFLAKLKPHAAGMRLISILAGKPIAFFEQHGGVAMAARFMPSLAASVGKSVTGVSFSASSDDAFRKDVLAVAGAIGSAFEIPERLMPAVTGVSGSGIAFVYEFAHAMAMGGVKTGLPYATALSMALDVFEGAAATLRQGKTHPMEMVSRVCSPAGSTVEGILELEKAGFQATVMQAVARAAERSRELEQ